VLVGECKSCLAAVSTVDGQRRIYEMNGLLPIERQLVDDMVQRWSELAECVDSLLVLHGALAKSFDEGGKLLVCGNGGSYAQAMHVVGELQKSFECARHVPTDVADKLRTLPFGTDLAANLEVGLPAITLGLNSVLKTAVENDISMRDIAFAQEAYALVKPGDVLIAISTSGTADNCLMAMSVANALGATTVALTGPDGDKMAEFADISVKAPGATTKQIQETHFVLCHTLCAMVEAHYFPE